MGMPKRCTIEFQWRLVHSMLGRDRRFWCCSNTRVAFVRVEWVGFASRAYWSTWIRWTATTSWFRPIRIATARFGVKRSRIEERRCIIRSRCLGRQAIPKCKTSAWKIEKKGWSFERTVTVREKCKMENTKQISLLPKQVRKF